MSTTATRPEAPEHLDDQAKAKWAQVVGILDERGEPLDAGTLDAAAAYCVAWSQWTAAQAKVAELGTVIKTPSGIAAVSPYVGVAAQAERRLRQWATELRLTPKARGKAEAGEGGGAIGALLREMDSGADG
jgi:P27 family predicted phage terminase small subunit